MDAPDIVRPTQETASDDLARESADNESFREMQQRTRRERADREKTHEHAWKVADAKLSDSIRTAFIWEAILDSPGYRLVDGEPRWGSAGAMLAECDPIGDAISGTHAVASMGCFSDPMWRPDGGNAEWTYIGELDPGHRRRLYGWLMQRAETLLGRHFTVAYASPFGMDDGAMYFMEQAEEELERDPWNWLAEQPFMRALAALLVGDGNGETVRAWELRAKIMPAEKVNGIGKAKLAQASEQVRGWASAQDRKMQAAVATLDPTRDPFA